MSNNAERRARFQALRARKAANVKRKARIMAIGAIVLAILACSGAGYIAHRFNAEALAIAERPVLLPGVHDGVCDAEDASPQWFADMDCSDSAEPALVDATCIGSAGTGHDCLVNTLGVRPCDRWDGSGSAHPCAWNATVRGVGDCPRVSGLSAAQCRLIAAGRLYVYV